MRVSLVTQVLVKLKNGKMQIQTKGKIGKTIRGKQKGGRCCRQSRKDF